MIASGEASEDDLLYTFAKVAICERQGMRPSMEDKVAAHGTLKPSEKLERASSFMARGTMRDLLQKKGSKGGEDVKIPDIVHGFFGVFDGHGGTSSAEFVSKALPKRISQGLGKKVLDYKSLLVDGFERCDKLLQDHLESPDRLTHESRSGCTAVTVLLEYNSEKSQCSVYCANLGDSRCIVVRRNGTFLPLSVDHVPCDAEEKKRIIDAGGEVRPARPTSSILRVFGVLSVTRSFGDFQFKQPYVSDFGKGEKPITEDIVLSTPDIKSVVLDPKQDLCIVLACDGIWNSFTNQQAAEFVAKNLTADLAKRKRNRSTKDEIESCRVVAELLTDEAISRGSTDNCTAMVLIPELVKKRPNQNKSSHCVIL